MKIFSLILIIGGVAAFVYGLLVFFGVIKTDVTKDSEMDKKIFRLSDKTRYFIGRYYAGIQGIIGGLGLVLLGIILFLNE